MIYKYQCPSQLLHPLLFQFSCLEEGFPKEVRNVTRQITHAWLTHDLWELVSVLGLELHTLGLPARNALGNHLWSTRHSKNRELHQKALGDVIGNHFMTKGDKCPFHITSPSHGNRGVVSPKSF